MFPLSPVAEDMIHMREI